MGNDIQKSDFVRSLIRNIGLFLDGLVYNLSTAVYNLLIEISKVSIFDADAMRTVSQRIYILIGVVMLFKLTFSVLTYIMNPDSMTDSSKGMSKLAQNIIIVLLALMGTPFIFRQALALQQILITENVVGKIVLGAPSDNISEPGDFIAFASFSAFINVNPTVIVSDGENNCDKTWEIDDKTRALKFSDSCEALLRKTKDIKGITGEELANQLKFAASFSSVSVITGATDGVANASLNGAYVVNYTMVISFIIGVFLSAMYFVFCFDVAVRVVKLSFLQLIAPIPILAYIDPNAGSGVTSKWIKECVKTYLDIFIRLAGLFFAVLVITNLGGMASADQITGEVYQPSALVRIFIILGSLLFAQQLPGLITSITGVELSGGGLFGNIKGAFGLVGRGVGAVAGIGTSMASNASASYTKHGGVARAGGAALWGGFKGLGAGAKGLTAQGGGMASIHAGAEAGRSVGAKSMARYGTGFWGRTKSRISQASGTQSYKERTDFANVGLETKVKSIQELQNVGQSMIDAFSRSDATYGFDDIMSNVANRSKYMENLRSVGVDVNKQETKDYLESLTNRTMKSKDWESEHKALMNKGEIEKANALKEFMKFGQNQIFNSTSGPGYDKTIQELKGTMNNLISQNKDLEKIAGVTSFEAINQVKGTLKNSADNIASLQAEMKANVTSAKYQSSSDSRDAISKLDSAKK